MPTVVYLRNNLPSAVSVAFRDNGPDMLALQLATSGVEPGGDPTVVARLPRADSGLFMLDFVFSVQGIFVSALGVLISSSGFGSRIWYRYRTSQKDLLHWVTDRDPHSVSQVIQGSAYSTTIQAQASFLGFDDLYVTLAPG